MSRTGALLGLLIYFSGIREHEQTVEQFEDKNVVKFINESYSQSCVTDTGEKVHWENPVGEKVGGAGRVRAKRMYAAINLYIKLDDIREEDAGTYTCVGLASNSSASFQLSVVRPITFDPSCTVQHAAGGTRNFLLGCAPSGHSPNIHISWKVDGNPVQQADQNYQVLNNGSLLIRNVTELEVRKSFVCNASDTKSPKPESRQMVIGLQVNNKMKPIMLPDSKNPVRQWSVFSNNYVNLICKVHAQPPAEFHWYDSWHDERGGPNEMRGFRLPKPQEENQSVLQVLPDSNYKFGKYTCRAFNEFGTLNQTFELLGSRNPPKPVLQLEAVGRNKAAILVSQNYGPGEQSEIWRWREWKDENEDVDYLIQSKLVGGTDWVDILRFNRTPGGFMLGDLEPDQGYVVRARSVLRSSGIAGDFSEALGLTTHPDGDDEAQNPMEEIPMECQQMWLCRVLPKCPSYFVFL